MAYNAATRTFDTIADLRLQSGTLNVRVSVLGYYVSGDCECRTYHWDSASTATDNSGSVIRPTAVGGASPGRWVLEFDNEVSVSWFGGRTSVDLIPVLNIMGSVLSASTQVIIRIPPGTWAISPTPSSKILLYSNVSICGVGKSTILRVINNAGDYGTIFGNTSSISNVLFRDFVIDQNSPNNGTCNIIVGDANSSQFAIYISVGFSNISIRNITVRNASGVNTFVGNATGASDISIQDCDIEFVPGRSVDGFGAQRYYDNSAIYFNCAKHIATGNKFSTASIANRATGGIESHNGESVISNNIFIKYQTAVNIVNETASKSRPISAISVTGNIVVDCSNGIVLYSITKGVSLTGVTVANNSIYLAQSQWNKEGSGISVAADTGLNPDGSERLAGLIANINISGNIIQFEDDVRSVIPNDYLSAGISLTGNNPIKALSIIGNTVINSPLKAFNIYALNNKNLDSITVSGNTTVDCGKNVNFVSQIAFRSLYFIGDNVTNSSIANNIIIDTGVVNSNGLFSFYRAFSSYATVNNITIQNNIEQSIVRLNSNIDNNSTVFYDYSPRTFYEPDLNSLRARTYETGDRIFNTKRINTVFPNGQEYNGTICVSAGTIGPDISDLVINASAGMTATVSSGAISNLKVGQYLKFPDEVSAKKIANISGSTITFTGTILAKVASSVIFQPPSLKPFGMVRDGRFVSPTTGTHRVGDICYSDNIRLGGEIGWLCTVAGSPGTWQPIGMVGLNYSGTGTPEAVLTAPIGSVYRQTNGANNTTLWTKTSGTGNTGWRPVNTNQETIISAAVVSTDIQSNAYMNTNYAAAAIGDTYVFSNMTDATGSVAEVTKLTSTTWYNSLGYVKNNA